MAEQSVQLTSKDGKDYLFPRTKQENVIGLSEKISQIDETLEDVKAQLNIIDGGTY